MLSAKYMFLAFFPLAIMQLKLCKYMCLCPGNRPYPLQRNNSLSKAVFATEISSCVWGQTLNPRASPGKKL